MASKHDSVKQLCAVVKSNSYPDSIRLSAIQGLGYAGSSEARGVLIEILKNKSYMDSYREAAAVALGRAASID